MSGFSINVDRFEHAYTRTQQLRALLTMTFGEGGETFRSLAPELQDNFLWAACDMVRDIEVSLSGAHTPAETEETQGA